jgi:hypothetical protein
MRPSPVRSLFAILAALGFATGVLGMGAMPACQVGTAMHHAEAGHSGGGHPGDHGHVPMVAGCPAHLCCAHLASGAPSPAAVLRLALTSSDHGRHVVAKTSRQRPPHTLPFANAPPPLPV